MGGSKATPKKSGKDARPPLQPIPPTKWPDAVPTVYEERVISVVCGNSHLQWAFHAGLENEFAPSLFWRTPSISNKDIKLGPIEALSVVLPQSAHDYIFGKGNDATKENAIRVSNLRRVPNLSVYVVASNEDQAKRLYHIWSEVPSRVYQMQGEDFFTEQQGRYETMGTDRCAVLYAAAGITGVPALVFDGGTAMTYSATDPMGKIIGGGISPGLGSKFKAMCDHTGALPNITPEELSKRIKRTEGKKGATIPIFASDTKEAMMSSVLNEVAHNCDNVIKHWLKEVGPVNDEKKPSNGDKVIGTVEGMKAGGDKVTIGKAQKDKESESPKNKNDTRQIIVTGGDADTIIRLLDPSHSNIIPTESGKATPEEKAEGEATPGEKPEQVPPELKPYEVRKVKHLIHYGIAAILRKKVKQQKKDPFIAEWENAIIGCRVAKTFNVKDSDGDYVFRGTVTVVTKAKKRDKDLFKIRYDDDDTEDFEINELYEALVKYSQVGEKGFYEGADKEEKKKTSKDTAAMILTVLEDLRGPADDRKEKEQAKSSETETSTSEKKRPAPDAPVNPVTLTAPANGNDTNDAKRAKTSEPAKENTPAETNKERYINDRIAKPFGKEIYFGTVTSYFDDTADGSSGLWHIVYDDGDEEDFDATEINDSLQLYAKHKSKDPQANGGL